MLHIYCGDGKGKTTAACGLSVRAAGRGMKVLFAQFLKNGTSGEVGMLRRLGVDVITQSPHLGMYKTLSDEDKAVTKEACERLFSQVRDSAREYDLIVLDELAAVCRYGIIASDTVVNFLLTHKNVRELVVTGRSPSAELLDAADYITEMKKLRHPYDSGTPARSGVEF